MKPHFEFGDYSGGLEGGLMNGGPKMSLMILIFNFIELSF